MTRFLKQDVACPVCGSWKAAVLYDPSVEVDDPVKLYGAASGVRGTQRLVKCGCGMIYENPRYPDDVILKGYAEAEDEHDSQHHMRVRSFVWALKRLGTRIPGRGARVLDIGCAGGAFLEATAHFGYDAQGLEPSKQLVEAAKKRGLKVEQGTIDQHPFVGKKFDMVTLWDVLEHVPDPKEALLEIARLLRPGGVLLINCPDIGTWQARLSGRRFWWILSVHLHQFTRETLTQLCARTGFRACHFQRYWQTLEFGYLEEMAARLGVPLSGVIARLTPGFIRKLPVPYYASQITALAKLEG